MTRQPVCDPPTLNRVNSPTRYDTTRDPLTRDPSTRLVKRVVYGLTFLTRQPVTRQIATPTIHPINKLWGVWVQYQLTKRKKRKQFSL